MPHRIRLVVLIAVALLDISCGGACRPSTPAPPPQPPAADRTAPAPPAPAPAASKARTAPAATAQPPDRSAAADRALLADIH